MHDPIPERHAALIAEIRRKRLASCLIQNVITVGAIVRAYNHGVSEGLAAEMGETTRYRCRCGSYRRWGGHCPCGAPIDD